MENGYARPVEGIRVFLDIVIFSLNKKIEKTTLHILRTLFLRGLDPYNCYVAPPKLKL